MSNYDTKSIVKDLERKKAPVPTKLGDYDRHFLLSQRGRLLKLAEKNITVWRVIRDIDNRLGYRTCIPCPPEDTS